MSLSWSVEPRLSAARNRRAEPGTPRIGLLSIGTDPDPAKPNPVWVAFLKGLDELGWVEGRKIIIERRFAGGVARFADVGRLDA